MAQTQLRTKKGQLQVVAEATADTHVSPLATAGSWFLAEDISYSLDSSNTRLGGISPSGFHMRDAVPGSAQASLSCRVPLAKGGDATAAPDWVDALKACGFNATASGTSSYIFKPTSVFDGSSGNPAQSYSINYIEDGMLYALKGAFGNVVFNCEVGSPGYMELSFSGAYVAVATQALVSPTYVNVTPPAFMGATFALNFGGSITPKGVSNFSLDCGNQIAVGPDVNETYGIYGARITGRDPSGSLDPEQNTSDAWFTKWASGTNGTIDTGVIGGTAGNRWRLQVNRVILNPPEMAENDGIRKLTLGYTVSSLNTDTEGTNNAFTLTWT